MASDKELSKKEGFEFVVGQLEKAGFTVMEPKDFDRHLNARNKTKVGGLAVPVGLIGGTALGAVIGGVIGATVGVMFCKRVGCHE